MEFSPVFFLLDEQTDLMNTPSHQQTNMPTTSSKKVIDDDVDDDSNVSDCMKRSNNIASNGEKDQSRLHNQNESYPEVVDEEAAQAYHENNQKFLREAEKAKASLTTAINPLPPLYQKPSQPRPPQKGLPWMYPRGVHRLKSIGDDEGSEETNEGSKGSFSLSTTERAFEGDKESSVLTESSSFDGEDESSFSHATTSPNTQFQIRKMNRLNNLSTTYDIPYVSSDSSSTTSNLELDRPKYESNKKSSNHRHQRTSSSNFSCISNITTDGESMNTDTAVSKPSKKKHVKRSKKEKKYIKKYYKELEGEKEELMKQWKDEFEAKKSAHDDSPWTDLFENVHKKHISPCIESISRILSYLEVFISNMPLTIGAVGLSWVTQGVIWFKFMEENIDSCTTVHFNSPQCSYPEFPGCFECDTSNPIYRFVVTFHYFCHCVAAACCLLFLLKLCIAWRVVGDELSNPTTATPCGVVCITLICVAAGRGLIGEIVVIATSIFHFALSIWFLYMAIYKFRLWPDPGWFPNTVGISYAAIKTWLYFPVPGKILLTICMIYLFSTFFISTYRVVYNHKIAAPVCAITLSAPSITMYAMTIMAQPSKEREMVLESSPDLMQRFSDLHREYYLPTQHFMMFLSLCGMVSLIHSFWARWPEFKHKPFSPAHVAFVFPILSHTNAVQAYRAGYDSFSLTPLHSHFRIALFSYWFTCLIFGTCLNIIFTTKYIRRLPKWTKIDELELEPPSSPSQTIVSEVLLQPAAEGDGIHEQMIHKSTVNPAVLQANEAGALVRVRRGTEEFERFGPYVRTRNVSALGFDPTMTDEELRRERAELLDWVAKRAPRTRHRTATIPTMMKLVHGEDGCDIYGTFVGDANNTGPSNNNNNSSGRQTRHERANTVGAWNV